MRAKQAKKPAVALARFFLARTAVGGSFTAAMERRNVDERA
jgi:hypothetical protein